MKSLEKIVSLNCAHLYPGHGAVVDNPTETLKQYIEHRNAREKQVLNLILESIVTICNFSTQRTNKWLLND